MGLLNLDKSAKLLKFALETGFNKRVTVELDIDLDGDGKGLKIANVFITLKSTNIETPISTTGLNIIMKEHEKVIQRILTHPNLQFQNDGSLGKTSDNNFLTVYIGDLKLRDEYIETSYICVIEIGV